MSMLPALLVLAVAALLLALDRRGQPPLFALLPLLVLVPLAMAPAWAAHATGAWAVLLVALVIAVLARDGADLLHGECAVKLLWVMGPALALSCAGAALLTVATGTPVVREQWGVLELGLDPRFLWSTSLPLSMLVGLVLLGGAPFHFWAADVFQGARPWLGPLAVTALQVAGAAWIAQRLDGIEAFPDGWRVAEGLLTVAAGIAFLAGAATLALQRRPERRIGTLASLHGALVLATLAATHGRAPSGTPFDVRIAAWSAHLVLALAGAATLARFLPVSVPGAAPGAALFRRHPVTGWVSLLPLFSLAGVPGTPGGLLWLDTARDLAGTGRNGLLLALGIAWLASFATAVRQALEAFGVPSEATPDRVVAWQVRVALWATSLGIGLLAVRAFAFP